MSGGQNSTSTTSAAPPPDVMAAYDSLINRGTQVANLPLQQWQGPTIAGLNPTLRHTRSRVGKSQAAAML